MVSIRYALILFTLICSVHAAEPEAAGLRSTVLNCTFRNPAGIFGPQQSIIIDLTLSVPNEMSGNWTLNAVLNDLSKPGQTAVTQFTTQITPQIPLPISFITPEKEGAYEIVLKAIQDIKPHRQLLGMQFSRQPEPISEEVRCQFIVLRQRDNNVVTQSTSGRTVGDLTLADTRELTSASDIPSHPYMPNLPDLPKVPDLLKISDIPRPGKLITELPKPGELLRLRKTTDVKRQAAEENTNGTEKTASLTANKELRREITLPSTPNVPISSAKHPEFFALPPASSETSYYSWQLQTEPGKPYLAEVDYPIGIPQTLGIAILNQLQSTENSATGTILAAADLHIAEELIQDIPTEPIATHRLLFWAENESPVLVLTNQQSDQEALYSKVRISRITLPDHQEDPRLPKLFEGKAQRKRLGQILKPAGFQNLTGIDPTSNWQQIYEGSSRLLDMLARGGYDGIALTVLSNDIILYPPANPQQNETFNCLELLFRRFDNEELTLIPAIEFNFLIPSLERLLAQHPGITEELLIADPNIRRYNLLYPAVQQAMTRIVQDITNRFGHHPSFGGIAIVISPESYAALPFTPRPPDDYTFMQFEAETDKELDIPFPDVEKFAQTMPIGQFLERKNAERFKFLQSNPKVWETWVRWRAAKVSGFYGQLVKEVTAKQSNASLYLLGGTILNQPEIQQFCAPTLPRNYTSLQALQLLGFDLPMLGKIDSLYFLRPVPVAHERNFCYDRLDSVDTVRLFARAGTLPGVQFVHADQNHFVTVPAHDQSRRRFVKQLTQSDVLMFMDSGDSLPMGQESAMFDLLDTYRRLPQGTFQTFQSSDEKAGSLQPLTVRYQNTPDGMIMYIVNDAPFGVEADFFFSADHRVTLSELSGRRLIRSLSRSNQQPGTHTWRATLLPYDLLAIRLSDSTAKIASVSVLRPEMICGAAGFFKKQVEELSHRVHVARNAEPLRGLVNPGFETAADATGTIPGWKSYGKDFVAQQNNANVGNEQYSMMLSNNSPEPMTFLSDPLSLGNVLPGTRSTTAVSRLGVSMLVGIPADSNTLPMSVVLTAKYQGEPISRNVPVGETLVPHLANIEPKNGVRWTQLLVPFERERLPIPLTEVRIGVQYWGTGTIWLDDVKVYPVLFSTNEMRELQKMLVVADQRCSSDRYSDLLSQLEGHWERYLFEHISLPAPQPLVAENKPVQASETPPPEKPTFYQRAKGWFGLGK